MDEPQTEARKSEFRLAFLPCFLFTFVAVSTPLLFMELIRHHFQWCWPHMRLVLLYSGIMSFVAMSGFKWYFVYVVGSDGIFGYNAWGKSGFLKWEQMIEIRRWDFAGLGYVRVFNEKGQSVIWIPLQMSHLERFKETLLRIAPEGNPLRQFFESRTE